MAKAAKPRQTRKKAATGPGGIGQTWQRIRSVLLRIVTGLALFLVFLIVLFRFVNPPTTHTIWTEGRKQGGAKQVWVAMEDIAPVMGRSAVAAEDANFCLHWGFDVEAIRDALEDGSGRGGSTISQQVVKNVFLWQGRSWLRKALETGITPMVELIWPKRRILEVYLNVAELDRGVFGVGAAAPHYFGVSARDLSALQAARLASVLPSPKTRSASNPTNAGRKRTRSIIDGAATIRADGRAACFED